jgi:hypothetical protein
MMTERLMAPKLNLGQYGNTPMSLPMTQYFEHLKGESDFPNPKGLRTIMGFPVPEWQRPLVWTREQSIRFIESAWIGIPLGSFSFYQNHDEPELDGLLVDGQQRLHAIQQYLEDEFPVYGYRWSELNKVDQTEFKIGRTFPSFTVKEGGLEFLKQYYNLMNFGGTAHTEDQRA